LLDELRAVRQAAADFVSIVSHEVRSPVTALVGLTQLLDTSWDRLTHDQRTEARAALSRQTLRLSKLIADLLDVSRIESGAIVFSPEAVDVLAAVTAALDALDAPGVEPTVQVAVEPGLRVLADRTYLRVVLSNLLANALTHGGSLIALTASRERRAAGGGDDDGVDVTVEDDGPGVAAEVVPRLFDRFSRGRTSTGSGLGLAIAHGLVEGFGGRLWYEPRDPAGATFHLWLPAA
jgi:signal transduction histidine kinase